MKFNVLRSLILPWVLYFIVALTAFVVAGVKFQIQAKEDPLFPILMGVPALLCLILNLRTLQKAGIWITHGLPSTLRFSYRKWLGNAVLAVLVAAMTYGIGTLSWIPLLWHAFVIPAVFALSLFVMVRSLIGPILKWSSNIAFGRTMVFLQSLPVLFLVPVTVIFLGETIVKAYYASRPDYVVTESPDVPVETAAAAPKPEESHIPEATSEKAIEFKRMVESGQSCQESNKDIQGGMNPNGPDDITYWAVRAVKCTELKSVVGLPRLVDVMTKHKNPVVRAAAIQAMTKFGTENVKRIAYLLVKRISENEKPEVIEAAAKVLERLGEDEKKWALNRLKNLMDEGGELGSAAAKVISNDMKREEIVAEYVATNLPGEPNARRRAVGMVCFISKANQAAIEPQIENIVATLTTGTKDDPGVKALDCLGPAGLQAIRREVIQPKHLKKVIAATALADMDLRGKPDALVTIEACTVDEDEQVRRLCSQSLGKIGAPALPKILELLNSGDSAMSEAGKNALSFFDDPSAREELQQVRASNSGWTANNRKLQIAEAIDKALIKLNR